jgi:hypothetical protein
MRRACEYDCVAPKRAELKQPSATFNSNALERWQCVAFRRSYLRSVRVILVVIQHYRFPGADGQRFGSERAACIRQVTITER